MTAKNHILSLILASPLIFPSVDSAAQRSSGPAKELVSLTVFPKVVTLDGKYAGARILLSRQASGSVRDIAGGSRWSSSDTRIATVDSEGVVSPVSNGRATITAATKWGAANVLAIVRGIDRLTPPSFTNDVLPALTRAGCNMGACHGAAQGKGGFRLSLQGFDPDSDYRSLLGGGKFRRVVPNDPENSLLLRKPLLKVAHKGGKRLRADSGDYRVLRDWIALGMPGPDSSHPALKRLEILPASRTLARGQSQFLIVQAHFSDKTVRDVTSRALFSAEDESVVSVTSEGEATATGQGEAAVLVRYQDQVAAARIISPFAPPTLFAERSKLNASPIDTLIDQKLGSLGLAASTRCSDSDFLRRAYLDLIGVLPTPDEARRFLSAQSPSRRERLVDELLERPEFVDFWAYRWADLLRVNRMVMRDKGAYSLYNWIRQSVAENKPWDRFAREIILASGGTFEHGPVNYFRANSKPEELAETTAQAFLGVRIQCAKCHNHPYEKWTQNQYYELAAFFARERRKDRGEESVISARAVGNVVHPKSGKNVVPAALGAPPIPGDFSGDRREPFAEWLTSPQNPFFSKVIANRLWRHFMGRGLVEPVDDMRVTNPPSNAPLLDYLGASLSGNGYDLKRFMRAIVLTDAYQRSAEPVKGSERDTKYYSHYPFKRMRAEQLMDALASATGAADKFDGFPAGFRASQLPMTSTASYFLDLFGRPARNITCECERTDDPNLGQILHLMNNSGINAKIGAKEGRISKAIERKRTNPQIVEELYLATFSRYPTPQELKLRITALDSAKDRKQSLEDLLWALVNSKEFLFNH